MKKILIGIIILAILIIVSFVGIRGFLFTGKSVNTENLEKITLKVLIPCGGHASLIRGNLERLEGVEKIDYTPITTFVVYYDKNKTSEAEILSLDIFKEYPAKKIN